MKKFLQFSVGAFLLMSGAALFMFSVQPAYGVRDNVMRFAGDTTLPLNVVYVNIDSINAKYIPYIELTNAAGGALTRTMEDYQRNATELNNRYTVLQGRVAMGTIYVTDAEKEEAAINDGLDKLKQQEILLADLETAAIAKNDSISMDIAVFFNEYAQANNIDYVLMYGTGMPIIYANDKLDVTDIVLKELNAPYIKEPESKKAGKIRPKRK